MSYTNLPPSPPFERLARVMRSQRRLMVLDVAATLFLAGALMAVVGALF
jgi:hypothetical protein